MREITTLEIASLYPYKSEASHCIIEFVHSVHFGPNVFERSIDLGLLRVAVCRLSSWEVPWEVLARADVAARAFISAFFPFVADSARSYFVLVDVGPQCRLLLSFCLLVACLFQLCLCVVMILVSYNNVERLTRRCLIG